MCPPSVPILSQLDPVHPPFPLLRSYLSITPGPRFSVETFRKRIRFYVIIIIIIIYYLLQWSFHSVALVLILVVGTSPNPQRGGPPLVGCPRRLIQYIRSCHPYWRPFLHLQPEGSSSRRADGTHLPRRQCTHDLIVLRVRVTTVAPETLQRVVCIVELRFTLNGMKMLSDAQQCFMPQQ